MCLDSTRDQSDSLQRHRRQVCCSVERVYVEASVLPDFEAACAKLAADFTAGTRSEER